MGTSLIFLTMSFANAIGVSCVVLGSDWLHEAEWAKLLVGGVTAELKLGTRQRQEIARNCVQARVFP